MKSERKLKRLFLDISLYILCALFIFKCPEDEEGFLSLLDTFSDYASSMQRAFNQLQEISSFQDLKWHFFGDPYLPLITSPSFAEFNHSVNRRLPFMINDTPLSYMSNKSITNKSESNIETVETYDVLTHLSNITHMLDCQVQHNGQSFMYYDHGVDGLMADIPLVKFQELTGGALGDGGKVKFENVPIAKWIKKIKDESKAAEQIDTSHVTRYCVEELEPIRRSVDSHQQKNNLTSALSPMMTWVKKHIAEGDVSDAFANLWVHGRGAVTQGHYDSAHNVLTQLVGTKRVTLLPPDAFKCLHLFPSFHPRARKSQIPIYAKLPAHQSSHVFMFPNFLAFIQNGTWSSKDSHFTRYEKKFPKFVQYVTTGQCDGSRMVSTMASTRASHKPYVVYLRPGDTISIPPYWFHFVESVEASISLNVFSRSSEERLMQAALFNTPLPFEADWPKRMYARAVYKYLDMIAKQLNINLSLAVRDLLESKYALSNIAAAHSHTSVYNIYEEDTCYTSDDSGQGAKGEHMDTEDESSAEWLPWCREPSIDNIIGVKSSSEGLSHTNFIAAVISTSSNIRTLMKMSLGNMLFEEFIENVVATMFGFESIPLFLCTCFTPVPLRDLLHGNEEGPPASLNARSCVRQWDSYVG